MYQLPVCSFPTTIVFVDDNESFLLSIQNSLEEENLIIQPFESANKCLSFLKNNYTPSPFTERWVKSLEEQEYERHGIDINIRELYKEIYNPSRFWEISTIVVDYNMPDMNGLELLNKLSSLKNVQKVLLTGEADEAIAIEAFNKGIINKFLRKQTPDLPSRLIEFVSKTQLEYFCTLSDPINDALDKSHSNPLRDPLFAQHFKTFIRQNNIIEFYLTQSSGTFLTLDSEKKLGGFFTYSDEDLETILDSQEAEEADVGIIHELASRRKILCINTINNEATPSGRLWKDIAFPATPIIGSNKIFYTSYIPGIFQLDENKIISLSEFKEKQEDL